MANYSTLLKSWGDTGTAYPDGYYYLEGEQPVDAWDNFAKHNVIKDVKHLISLTNDRIETDKGADTAFPTSPESSHLYHDTTNETLHFYDSTAASWHRVLAADGDALEGALDFAGYAAQNVGPIDLSGALDVAGQNIVDGATTVYDAATGQFSDADTLDGKHASELGASVSDDGTQVLATSTDFNFGSNLSVTDDGDGTVTVDAQASPDTHTGVSEDGVQMHASVGDINFTGHLNVTDDGDGTVTIDPTHNHDSRYYTETEIDTKLGGKSDTGHTHDGRYYTKSQTRSWVNNNADVPNADYADSAGNADTVDGQHASQLGKSTAEVQDDSVIWNEGFAPGLGG